MVSSTKFCHLVHWGISRSLGNKPLSLAITMSLSKDKRAAYVDRKPRAMLLCALVVHSSVLMLTLFLYYHHGPPYFVPGHIHSLANTPDGFPKQQVKGEVAVLALEISARSPKLSAYPSSRRLPGVPVGPLSIHESEQRSASSRHGVTRQTSILGLESIYGGERFPCP